MIDKSCYKNNKLCESYMDPGDRKRARRSVRPTELIDRQSTLFVPTTRTFLFSSQLTCLILFCLTIDIALNHGYLFPSSSRQHYWYTLPSSPSSYPTIANSVHS